MSIDFNKDYYKILNLPRNATSAQIKKTYRNLALRFHPDRAPDDLKQEAERIFKEIGDAYEILSDTKKKAMYDLQYSKPIHTSKDDFSNVYSNYESFFKNRPYLTSFSQENISSPYLTKGRIFCLILTICYLIRLKLFPFFDLRFNVIFPFTCLVGIWFSYEKGDEGALMRIAFWFAFICALLSDITIIQANQLYHK